MKEYIERETLLNYADCLRPSESDYFNVGVAEEMCLDKEKEIADELKKLPYDIFSAFKPIVGWYSVKDMMPHKGQSVLCVGKNGGMFIGEIRENLFREDSCGVYVPNARCIRYATHWLPLPEPPTKINNRMEQGKKTIKVIQRMMRIQP